MTASSPGRAGLCVLLVTPAPRGTRYGNRVSALRWARLLRPLGHRVDVTTAYTGQRCDVMIALHAGRSAAAMASFKERCPDTPLVLCLTGTDVYRDIQRDANAQHSLEIADQIVVLQPLAIEELPDHLRPKAVSIVQSACPTPDDIPHCKGVFEVCVVGHMRPVKDPLRAAMASRLLPPSSRLRVLQVGGAMAKELGQLAQKEAETNPRYRWLGELPAWKTRRIMKRCQLMVISSVLEGGANVVCEALADSVPVIGSRIPGNIGLLGEDYPGYYTTGSTQELADLLHQTETNPDFLQELRQRCDERRHLVLPEAEQTAWSKVLETITHRP